MFENEFPKGGAWFWLEFVEAVEMLGFCDLGFCEALAEVYIEVLHNLLRVRLERGRQAGGWVMFQGVRE